jgi:hypothetical protein
MGTNLCTVVEDGAFAEGSTQSDSSKYSSNTSSTSCVMSARPVVPLTPALGIPTPTAPAHVGMVSYGYNPLHHITEKRAYQVGGC